MIAELYLRCIVFAVVIYIGVSSVVNLLFFLTVKKKKHIHTPGCVLFDGGLVWPWCYSIPSVT